MKRFVLLPLLLSFLFLYSLSAQRREIFKNQLYLGLGGGGASVKMDFVPHLPQELKIGYQGGVAAKYISEKNLGLIVELNYSQRGWAEEYEIDPDSELDLDYSYSRNLNYLEIPFLTHLYFGKRFRFIFNLGPQISLLLNDKQIIGETLADNESLLANSVQYSPITEMRRFDYGLLGGVGVELNLGIGTFDLEGRYYFGLGDLFENRRSENAFFARSAHRIIEAKLTYYIKVN